MTFDNTHEWTLQRMDQRPTLLQCFENENNEFFLRFTIMINPSLMIPVFFTLVDNKPTWGMEFGVGYNSLSPAQKIEFYCKLPHDLLTTCIWLGYPDLVSDVQDSDLNLLKRLQRFLNGTIRGPFEVYYEDTTFFYLIRHIDWAAEGYKISDKEKIDLGRYKVLKGWGKSVKLSEIPLVKTGPQGQPFEEIIPYPENIEQEKARIARLQTLSLKKDGTRVINEVKINLD